MAHQRNVISAATCLLLVSLMVQYYSVEGNKPCKADDISDCKCITQDDCPQSAICIGEKNDLVCHCVSSSFSNGTHVLRCNPCTKQYPDCPPLSSCRFDKQQCECEFGSMQSDSDGNKPRYSCTQCATAQDCPAFSECSNGKCKCKYGEISRDIPTDKVLQCEDNNVKPITVIAIAVPLTALIIGIAGVIAFYLYWRYNVSPAASNEGKGFVKEEKTYHLQETGDNPAFSPTAAPTQPALMVEYSSKEDKAEIHPAPPQVSPVIDHETKSDPMQEKKSHEAQKPQYSPVYYPPKSDLPVTSTPILTTEALHEEVPTQPRKDDGTDAIPKYHRSKDDLAEEDSPPIRLNGDFQSVPSHESDSEEEDDEAEPAVLPVQHQVNLHNQTEAPLLAPSTYV